jgi:hypothetical protein
MKRMKAKASVLSAGVGGGKALDKPLAPRASLTMKYVLCASSQGMWCFGAR